MDFSLAGLIQIMCTEQKQATLLLRHPNLKEGYIFFNQGEIIHAQIGSLMGIDAMFRLLSWKQGAFRTANLNQVPPRTINTPWRYILLEGMQKVDEEKADSLKGQSLYGRLTAKQIEADDHLEFNFVTLLSKLEHSCTQLKNRGNGIEILDLLQALIDMVNDTGSFIQAISGTQSRSLSELIKGSCEAYPTLRFLTIRDNRFLLDVISSMYETKLVDKEARSEIIWNTASGLIDVQEGMFLYIVSLFSSFAIANQWRDTCQLFLEDITETVSKTKNQ